MSKRSPRSSDDLTWGKTAACALMVTAVSWCAHVASETWSESRGFRDKIAELQQWRLSAEQSLRNCKP